jgi:hypothetical protein
MEIAEAIQICRLQEFWDEVITEYAITHPSPRRRQELWILLRSKLIVELMSIGEPIPEMLKRFQQHTKDIVNLNQKRPLPSPMPDANVNKMVERKLDAISSIYNAFTNLTEETR